MNLQRAYEISRKFVLDQKVQAVISDIELVHESLQTVISNPSIIDYQRKYSATKEQLRASSTDILAGDFCSPTDHYIVEKFGFDTILSKKLTEELDRIFGSFDLGQVFVEKELSAFAKLVAKIFENAHKFNESCESLGAVDSKPFAGDQVESEIGISIPRNRFGNDLSGLLNVLKGWNQHLNSVSEFIEGKTGQYKIKVVSTSEYTLYLQAGTQVAVFFAGFVTSTIATIKEVLDIISKVKDLRKQGVPEDSVQSLKDYCDQKIMTLIQVQSKALISNCKISDKGSLQELTTSAERSVKFFVKEIKNGSLIEVSLLNEKELDLDFGNGSTNGVSFNKGVIEKLKKGHAMNGISADQLAQLNLTFVPDTDNNSNS